MSDWWRWPCCLAMLANAAVSGSVAEAERPQRISKPRPAPPGISVMRPLPRATIDDTLQIGGEDIKAQSVETRLTVEVKLNGNGPYRFLVDSGADTSVVGLRIARSLNLPIGKPATLYGMTERSIVDRVEVDSLTLGSSTTRNLQLPALREEDMGAQGMIGIDALVRRRLLLDFDKRSIKVEDAMVPPQIVHGEIVVTARRKRGQLILTGVEAAGLSLEAVIDTGAQVTIGNSLLRDKLVRRRQKFEIIRVIGVTGKISELKVAWIPELRIGQLVVRNIPVAFADLLPFEAFGLADQPALLIGTDVLETFRRVSLDFQARKVRFQLRRCAPAITTVQVSGTPVARC